MKTMEELRELSADIINLVQRNELTVEEGIFVIENAKFFLAMAKIVGDFDKIKLQLLAFKAREKAGMRK